MLGDMKRQLFLIFLACGLGLPYAQADRLGYSFGFPGGMSRYYAPNNKSVQWRGNVATIVVFGFGRVRQGEIWLSREGVSGKSVLSCPHDGFGLAHLLLNAMNKANTMTQQDQGKDPAPESLSSIPMGEHVAEFYAELEGQVPLVRIDFGPQDSAERHTYRFNLQASYRLVQLLATMCHSLHGPGSAKHSRTIQKWLKAYSAQQHHPHHHNNKKKKPSDAKKPDQWLN